MWGDRLEVHSSSARERWCLDQDRRVTMEEGEKDKIQDMWPQVEEKRGFR